MRRRELLAGIGTATLPVMAGCDCLGGETWPGLGFVVEPTALTRTGDGWAVDATVELLFTFGQEETGMDGVSLAAFDQTGGVVGTTRLGDLTWSDVPEGNRTEGECGSSGTLQREAAVEADVVPQWVGIRYDSAPDNYGEPQEIAVYRGQAGSDATVDGYEQVRVDALTPASDDVETAPPVESVTFEAWDLDCETPTTPDVEHSVSESTAVDVTAARTLPAPHYRATLSGFEYGEVLRFDIGVGPRPQLRRRDCTTAEYEVSVSYDGDDRVPQEIELRHLGRDGTVVETIRRPLRGAQRSSPASETPTR